MARNVAGAASTLTERTEALSVDAAAFTERLRYADRRTTPRHQVKVRADLNIGGAITSGQLADISEGGARLETQSKRHFTSGQSGRLRISGFGTELTVRIVEVRQGVLHLAFAAGEDGRKVVSAVAGMSRNMKHAA